MAKKKITIEAEKVAAPKADHKHLFSPVGAIREGEFMEQCAICALMRRIDK